MVKYHLSFSFKFNFNKKYCVKKILLFCLLLSFIIHKAQNIFGTIKLNNYPVAGALIINLSNERRTTSTAVGFYSINAKIGDKIRIVREGYENINFSVQELNTSYDFNLNPIPKEIEEVVVTATPTGDLTKDSEAFGRSLKDRRVNDGIRKTMKLRSEFYVQSLRKPGDFVQPVGKGIPVMQEIDNKWALPDCVEWLHSELTDEYFAEFGLESQDVNRFLSFSLMTMDKKTYAEILKYGYISPFNMGQIKQIFEKTILTFKKNPTQKKP
ncbi:hypothetical protein SAMN05660477_01545 [Soonwooa buanensis]|uniref:CarboxypepD_reg-like domain-containing protein n=1 Tax=Soonwooa buanensis TaxID=619805 RepID=A0A1T5ETR5_9FLAO|nr:hypothetical protein SAMN05660477_01545 [Soonwooa buanensis]